MSKLNCSSGASDNLLRFRYPLHKCEAYEMGIQRTNKEEHGDGGSTCLKRTRSHGNDRSLSREVLMRQGLRIRAHLNGTRPRWVESMQIVAFCIAAFSLAQAFSFEKTFKPPRHAAQQSSDDREILERSSFSQEEEEDGVVESRFGEAARRKQQPQLVHYPLTCCWNPCCNRDKEITVTIQKNAASTTTKPEVFCHAARKEDDVATITDKELRFISDYLNDDEDSFEAWEYFDYPKTTTTTERPSGAEEIVIKIVEKSPPCQNSAEISDRFDFMKVKLGDVLSRNCSRGWH